MDASSLLGFLLTFLALLATLFVFAIGIIAHARGVDGPRRLRREHRRIVAAPGRSVPLNELYPEVRPSDTEPVAA